MKVLFVARAGSNTLFKTVVNNQYLSLTKELDQVEFFPFPIKGNGIKAYIKSTPLIYSEIRKQKIDIIHAHYSFSGLAAGLAALGSPVVVSLMGSDVEAKGSWLRVIRFFSQNIWKSTIVKSYNLKEKLSIEKLVVIPNGVNIKRFMAMDQEESKKNLNWDTNRQQLLFLADPKRKEKNFNLAKEAFERIGHRDLELQVYFDIAPDEIPTYLNAADVVLLSSLWEGSPNVIKEALACNRPIVATDVGDIKWLIGNTNGCYVTSFEPEDVAGKVLLALQFAKEQGRTNGRDRIMELGLDSETVANKLVNIYKAVLEKRK